MRFGVPLRRLGHLRFRATCRQVTRFLSCGSSELRRSPNVVGPYWLSPSSSPLARFFLPALGHEVFRHPARTRGCKHKRVLPPVFFDATAEYCRSDESSDSCAVPVSVDVCAGQTPNDSGGGCASGYRGFTRGWVPKFERHITSKPATRRPRGPDRSTRLTRASVPS